MNASHPLVSIVLPTYNGALYLGDAIEGCLSQTYANWELIIIDDASTDGAPGIIAKYLRSEQRIRSIRHSLNRRLPAALNTGFAVARGEYHTWTSDDNRYRPNAIGEMVKYLEGHSEAAVVYADYTIVGQDDNVARRWRVPDSSWLTHNNCIGPCFLYRAEVYREVGPYAEDLFLAEDFDFWLRVSMKFRLEPLNEDLYLYRRHPNSLTGTAPGGVLAATEKALGRTLNYLHWATKAMKARAFVELARSAQRRRDWHRMATYLIRAASTSPTACVDHVVRRLLVRATSRP